MCKCKKLRTLYSEPDLVSLLSSSLLQSTLSRSSLCISSLERKTIDSYHNEFKGLVVHAVSNEVRTMHGIPFLNLMHDMWTSKSVKAVLDVSISYIDSNWKKDLLGFVQ